MNIHMNHTNTVYQFVPPRIKFPTKPLSFCRALGALHGSHSVFFLPLSPSTERQEASRDDAAAQPLILLLPLFARTQPAVCTVTPPATLLRYYNQCHVCKPGLNRNNKFTAAKKVMFLLAFISLFLSVFFPRFL